MLHRKTIQLHQTQILNYAGALTNVKQQIQVKNHASQRQLPDNLHLKVKRTVCPGSACLGSLMENNIDSKGNKRTKVEIFTEAAEFIEEYFTHLKKHKSVEMVARIQEISDELDATGTYTPTTVELEFGAKTAWRNASRCIGRIQWQNLNLFDARYVSSTADMFEAVCKHLQFATNNGNIRSCITVFPPRVTDREDFRVWNSQLISYAGYLQPDGTVIGDPARVAFTRICEKLGWQGQNGSFDVLPLVFSAPGERATWYELPKKLIMEVNLEHPGFDWFAEMNLRWYALPAVSDMLFDVGGIQFPAAPFNGWYMGTEIGARDFCDEQRYNLLPVFAKKMGLATDYPTSLWKDEVLLEVNKAVLYSFVKMGATIVDHHTASQQFLQHMANETKKRGGCPADWIWIVPPISGSVTAVYHQEMVNYKLKPAFEYQERAWKDYEWEKVELKTRFSTIGYAVLSCVRLMNVILANRVKATILFATETGRSEMFAEKLRKKLSSSFSVRIIRMDDYDLNSLPLERLLFVVASTFGNGGPPDNGKLFWQSLVCNAKKSDSFDLKNLVYSVFALGSSLYPNFGEFGRNVDKMLFKLNAKSLKPVTTGDEMKGQEKIFSMWCDAVYTKSIKVFRLEESDDQDYSDEDNIIDDKEGFSIEAFEGSRYRIKMVDSTQNSENDQLTVLSKIHGDRRYPPLFPMKVISQVHLQTPNNRFKKQSLLVRMRPSNQLASHRLIYEPGDHLGIFPLNPPKLVNALLYHLNQRHPKFGDLGEAVLNVECSEDNKNWITQNRLPPCTIREAFSSYLDIHSAPEQRFLGSMSLMAENDLDRYRLKQLAQEPDEYKSWKMLHFPNLLDVLNEFPSVHLTPEFLILRLPLLAPRLYSISSSLSAHPDEVHLTMALVTFPAHQDEAPEQKLGVCSSFFERFPVNDVLCFVRPAHTFHLPDNNSLPIILIGAGSGIAPFRSFWQEREAIANRNGITSLGRCVLFFGCRSKSVDYIYQEEHARLLRSGILHKVFLALSCEENHEKTYVQDELYAQRRLVYTLLEHEGAHIYVCGDAQMADGVRQSLVKVYTSEGSCNERESVNDLFLDHNRYHEDVFGAIHCL